MKSLTGALAVIAGLIVAFPGRNIAGLVVAAMGAAILISDERRSTGRPLR